MKIDSLTTNEKVVLAQQLWDSVAANEDSLDVSADSDQSQKYSEIGSIADYYLTLTVLSANHQAQWLS